MESLKRDGHIAGAIYLALIFTGVFYLMYVPTQIMDSSDPAATLANLASNEQLYRVSIVVELLSSLIYGALALAFYHLFAPVHKPLSTTMVMLVFLSIPIAFVNASQQLSVLQLLSGSGLLQNMDASSVESSILLAIDRYYRGIAVSTIFWGLWLLPLGLLILRSGYLPKVLGILLILGCFGYLINFTGRAVYEGYADTILPRIFGLPATFGEFGTCLWLLIFGARPAKQAVSR